MKRILPFLLLLASLVLSGCGDSHHFNFTDNTGAPIAVDDAYATAFDTPFSVSALEGVLVNDALNAYIK